MHNMKWNGFERSPEQKHARVLQATGCVHYFARSGVLCLTCILPDYLQGIADWASVSDIELGILFNYLTGFFQDAYGSYSNLITAISGVCFVGAGLTYSSIFRCVFH